MLDIGFIKGAAGAQDRFGVGGMSCNSREGDGGDGGDGGASVIASSLHPKTILGSSTPKPRCGAVEESVGQAAAWPLATVPRRR